MGSHDSFQGSCKGCHHGL
jgi:hypothetical protein